MNIENLKNAYNIINILIESNLIGEEYLLSKIDNLSDFNKRYEITFNNKQHENIIFIYLNEKDKFSGYLVKKNQLGNIIREKIKFEKLLPTSNIYAFSINYDNPGKETIIYYCGDKENGYKKIDNNELYLASNNSKTKSLKKLSNI